MSEGPIKQWRDGFKTPPSVPKSRAIHFDNMGFPYCGRLRGSGLGLTTFRMNVTCADCIAAIDADDRVRAVSGVVTKGEKR